MLIQSTIAAAPADAAVDEDEVEHIVPMSALTGESGVGAVLSGQYVASMMQMVGSSTGAGPVEAKLHESVRAASTTEQQHEIIALDNDQLSLHEPNWQRFRKESEHGKPTLVVSFLGDTSAGKSHTIRELIGDVSGVDRPFCQAAGQVNATTFNVNLYVCKHLVPDVTLNFLDLEGENGTEAPVMATARSLAAGATGRHKAVSEMFPKLAYTTSDVLVVVCREPFFNRRYLERSIELAKRANSGVHNVDHPALVLIGNKLPGEECELDVRKSTDQFFDAWGDEANTLNQYFSAVICLYIPHKRGMWLDADENLINGADVFKQQLEQLKVSVW